MTKFNTGAGTNERREHEERNIFGFIDFDCPESWDTRYKTYIFTFSMLNPSALEAEFKYSKGNKFSGSSDLVEAVAKSFSKYAGQFIG